MTDAELVAKFFKDLMLIPGPGGSEGNDAAQEAIAKGPFVSPSEKVLEQMRRSERLGISGVILLGPYSYRPRWNNLILTRYPDLDEWLNNEFVRQFWM